MIRTIIRPEKRQIKLDIPEDYVGKEIEVTYILLDELNARKTGKPAKNMKDFWGKLSDKTADKLHQHISKSRQEWERNI